MEVHEVQYTCNYQSDNVHCHSLFIYKVTQEVTLDLRTAKVAIATNLWGTTSIRTSSPGSRQPFYLQDQSTTSSILLKNCVNTDKLSDLPPDIPPSLNPKRVCPRKDDAKCLKTTFQDIGGSVSRINLKCMYYNICYTTYGCIHHVY